MGCFMYQYPKQILTIEQQVQSYVDAGMKITSQEDVEKALKSIGFYRFERLFVSIIMIMLQRSMFREQSLKIL